MLVLRRFSARWWSSRLSVEHMFKSHTWKTTGCFRLWTSLCERHTHYIVTFQIIILRLIYFYLLIKNSRYLYFKLVFIFSFKVVFMELIEYLFSFFNQLINSVLNNFLNLMGHKVQIADLIIFIMPRKQWDNKIITTYLHTSKQLFESN